MFSSFPSWLFEEFSREDAINVLQSQPDGTFLVRPSGTIKGDLVLCVKYVSSELLLIEYDFVFLFFFLCLFFFVIFFFFRE